MTTASGYIKDQRCPIEPSHGNAYRIGNGYFCPHSMHTKPGGQTTAFWHLDEWEKIKSDDITSEAAQPLTNRTRNKPIPRHRTGKSKRPKGRGKRPA